MRMEFILISNQHPAEYEFGEMTQAILAILPPGESSTLTVDNAQTVSKDILKEKVEVLQKCINYVAAPSAVAAAVPIPGVSIVAHIAMIKSEINFYISQLGLPQEGSNRFSLLIFTRTEIKALSTALGSAMGIGGLVVTYSTESAVEEFSRYILFIGIVIASPLSYGATYYFLSKWLKQLEEIALKVLEETSHNVRSHQL